MQICRIQGFTEEMTFPLPPTLELSLSKMATVLRLELTLLTLSVQTRMDREDVANARKLERIRQAMAASKREQDAKLALLKERTKPGYAWVKGASETFLRPKPRPKPTTPFVPSPAVVELVQTWLDKNFTVKPVPLILHVPRNLPQIMGMSKTPAEALSHLPTMITIRRF